MKKFIFVIAFTMVAAFSYASVNTNGITSNITQEEPKKEKAEATEAKSDEEKKACAEKKAECKKTKKSCSKPCGAK